MQSNGTKNARGFIDLTGKRFGKWTVIKRSNERVTYPPFQKKWECICDCGVHAAVFGRSLRTGDNTNCGCIRNHKFRLRPYEGLFHLFEHSTKARPSIVSLLTYEQFAEFAKQTSCHYCKSTVSFQKFSAKSAKYNLDRKDNTKHYTKDNLVVCCRTCNFAKGNKYSYEEWVAMTKALVEIRKVKAQTPTVTEVVNAV